MEDISPPENVINLSVVRMFRKLDKYWKTLTASASSAIFNLGI